MRILIALVAATSLAAPQERVSVTLEAVNIKLSYPKSMQRGQPPGDAFQLAVAREDMSVLLSAFEGNHSAEEIAASFEAEQKKQFESLKVLRRQEIAVAGEKAQIVEMEMKQQGITRIVMLAAFTHQGMGYRFLGIRNSGKMEAFKEDFYAIVDSVEFIKDRKDWLERYAGKPTRTAFLGGLAQFELKRPRWTETTLDHAKPDVWQDQLVFKSLAGGMQIMIVARETLNDVATELNYSLLDFTGPIPNTKTTKTTVPGRNGPVQSVESIGEVNGRAFFYRAAVLAEEGIAVRVQMGGFDSQREATRADWEQLLKSFHLQRRSKAMEPLALPLPRAKPAPTADASLAVALSKSTRVMAAHPAAQVLMVAPDGNRAMVRRPRGVFIENLATGIHEAAVVPVEPGHPVAWSQDGRWLAYGAPNEVVVVGLDGKNPRRFPATIADVSFGRGQDELLLCAHDGVSSTQPRFATNRLERLNLATGKRQVLVDFPLGRVEYPVLSPDGKRLALVCNRDCPRTERNGGHLYVGAADGTGLKQLTRGPEDFNSVDWSPDGKWLYVVRRPLLEGKAEAGPGAMQDLYRVSPETGEAVNLTRSGFIARAWAAGAHVVMETFPWSGSEGQRGLFRVHPDELAAATASRPASPAIERAGEGKKLAAAVKISLGQDKPEDVLLTPVVLAKVAKAFAEGAGETGLGKLDFSKASLDRLQQLANSWTRDANGEPAIVLGLGAYYGETLRLSAGAEWRLKPARLGDGAPLSGPAANAFVQAVLPFPETPRNTLLIAPAAAVPVASQLEAARQSVFTANNEVAGFRNPEGLAKLEGRKLLLVYPPAHVAEAVRQATPPDFLKAMTMLDAGEVRPALDLLTREIVRQPGNAALAHAVLAVCEAARLPEVARELAGKAVAAGSEVPELLVLEAEKVAKSNPARAVELYRKAANGEAPSAESYLKIGQHHASLGQPHLAEVCYRRAFWIANDIQKRQVRKLMGLPDNAAGPTATAAK